ncbi:ParA-like protein (plasmid) [Piscirickettsia salmonis]|uniref:ParA family protein n=1 Tax=Piscirickettsia salmonis TaxID=1238 RepID=UPI001E2C4FBF|nr:ParA family protein [Piscirickettsia salmonis]QGP66702.1 ParA-like protein [Piscirickettsia salmonis]
MARVIAFGSKKGGVGKSMCISNLAVMASLMGAGVKIIDSDKQGSSIKFINRRARWDGLSPITCSHAQGISMVREIEAADKVYDVVLVDLAGTDNGELREIMLSPFIGELYTPLQPSGEDLETLTELEALVHIAKQSKPEFKLYTLLNRLHVNPKVIESKSAITFLSSRVLSEFRFRNFKKMILAAMFRRMLNSGQYCCGHYRI